MQLWLVLRYYDKGVTVTTAAKSQAEAYAMLSNHRSCYVTLRLVVLRFMLLWLRLWSWEWLLALLGVCL